MFQEDNQHQLADKLHNARQNTAKMLSMQPHTAFLIKQYTFF